MQCRGELTLQQAYLQQLLLGYVNTGTEECERHELKSVVQSTNNSNASTDEDEACATPFGSS